MMSDAIRWYDQNVSEVSRRYESVAAETVHGWLVDLLAVSPLRELRRRPKALLVTPCYGSVKQLPGHGIDPIAPGELRQPVIWNRRRSVMPVERRVGHNR
jgi:hypothetical protein